MDQRCIVKSTNVSVGEIRETKPPLKLINVSKTVDCMAADYVPG